MKTIVNETVTKKNHHTYIGNKNKHHGNFCTYIGNKNTIFGNHNKVIGNHNKVIGDFNNLTGNYNEARGTTNQSIGDYCVNHINRINTTNSNNNGLRKTSITVRCKKKPRRYSKISTSGNSGDMYVNGFRVEFPSTPYYGIIIGDDVVNIDGEIYFDSNRPDKGYWPDREKKQIKEK